MGGHGWGLWSRLGPSDGPRRTGARGDCGPCRGLKERRLRVQAWLSHASSPPWAAFAGQDTGASQAGAPQEGLGKDWMWPPPTRGEPGSTHTGSSPEGDAALDEEHAQVAAADHEQHAAEAQVDEADEDLNRLQGVGSSEDEGSAGSAPPTPSKRLLEDLSHFPVCS